MCRSILAPELCSTTSTPAWFVQQYLGAGVAPSLTLSLGCRDSQPIRLVQVGVRRMDRQTEAGDILTMNTCGLCMQVWATFSTFPVQHSYFLTLSHIIQVSVSCRALKSFWQICQSLGWNDGSGQKQMTNEQLCLITTKLCDAARVNLTARCLHKDRSLHAGQVNVLPAAIRTFDLFNPDLAKRGKLSLIVRFGSLSSGRRTDMLKARRTCDLALSVQKMQHLAAQECDPCRNAWMHWPYVKLSTFKWFLGTACTSQPCQLLWFPLKTWAHKWGDCFDCLRVCTFS